MPLGQDVVEKVKTYIKQAEDGGHVAAISNLFTYLKSCNLMYTQRVIPLWCTFTLTIGMD